MIKYSFVIPVLNEAATLATFIAHLNRMQAPCCEFIFVDGGSSDATCQLLERVELKSVIVVRSGKGRALQMNAGAARATGAVVIFLHADTYLPDDALMQLSGFDCDDKTWGRFDVRLNNTKLAYRVISWFINIRSRWSGIATGDQAMFVRRRCFENMGGFPLQPLMEDVEISRRLKKISAPYCIGSQVETSARKWEQNGVISTVLLMWRLRIAYALGTKPEVLVKQYYP